MAEKAKEATITMTQAELDAFKASLINDVMASLAKNEAVAVEAKAKMDKETEAFLNEEVTISLFKDGKDYKDDVFIAINGKNYVIRRGVPIKLKRKYVLVLEQQSKQDTWAAEYQEQLQREFRMASNRLGF